MNRIAYILIAIVLVLSPSAAAAQTGVSLTAPSQAGINEAIDVEVGGTPAKGDIVRFADADGTVLGGSYAYVGNAKQGKLVLSAPLEPGAYQVVYLSNREIVASSPLVVHAVTATLDAPERVGINETFEVSFEGPLNKGDILKVVLPDGKAVGGSYAYAGLAKDNRLSLKAPSEAGAYLVTYETGRKVIGRAEFEVFSVQATLTAPESIQAGGRFVVAWEGPNNQGDMLRIRDASGQNTGSYGYVGISPDGVPLRAPEQAGEYAVVYLTAGTVIGEAAFRVTEVSANLDAAAQVPGNERFKVSWEGPGNYGDVIQLIPQGETDDVAYAYIDPESPGSVMMTAPVEPGPHNLVYLTRGRRELARHAIEITPPVQQPGLLAVVAETNVALGPDDAIEVILDASGSMLQRQAGERRIDIAKRTLNELITSVIPAGTPFAMRVFGHQEADTCRTDLEIPLAPLNASAASKTLNNITAMNLAKTPIADSLALTDSDLSTATGERIVVLVTDGEETCDGDPAEVIAELKTQGQDIRFNIVGYAIDDLALQRTFERWATLGGGAYFNVADEAQLATALTHSVNPSFVVLDEAGNEITAGVAGDEPISLLPGQYVIRSSSGEYPAVVKPETITHVNLAAGAD